MIDIIRDNSQFVNVLYKKKKKKKKNKENDR